MIYSPLDGQPCADHDRATGEGVLPQEYVLIKMELIPPFPLMLKALEGRNVYLAAATLRPEILYGQTNCWVQPDRNYGAFEVNDIDVFILTARSARNLAYQMLSKVPEKPTCLAELCGRDLIGLQLKSPLAFNEIVYVLPMQNISTDKGTGIVTRVPSDSPDDFIAFQELVTSPGLRAMYGVKDEWVFPFKVIPVINVPGYGNETAKKAIEEFSSDATRFALADAGDSLDDANFAFGTAKSAIMKLTKEISWMKEVLSAEESLQQEMSIDFHVEQEDSMVLMRKLLQKQGSDLKKAKKGAVAPATSEENKLSVGLIYVNENHSGWKEQRLRVLQAQFEPKSCSFAPDEQIIEALKNYSIGQEMDLKQIQKLCMPFIKFKKDEAQKVGLQALELTLPFSELEGSS
ncbi:Leucine--tRNA ligase, cytoplasmic [Dichanthelium oligosanthes]|uniref:leucine--tRNA ligase n=1 Tax=Dichanthelium oligosanthes TaxID=888268 RepID=A0A1E5VMM8_9POAL|nr:Leucine--tRNA ligase, cytoplasmic [Dichanthelium oligosanthes]